MRYSEMRHRLDFPARGHTGGDGAIARRQIFASVTPAECKQTSCALFHLPSESLRPPLLAAVFLSRSFPCNLFLRFGL